MEHHIRVLIVEASAELSERIAEILAGEPGIEVSHATTAEEALALVEKEKPDLITVALDLPGLDGLSFTRQVMEKDPIPIVVVSEVKNSDSLMRAFEIIEAGALAVVETPGSEERQDNKEIGQEVREEARENFRRLSRQLITTVKAMSEVKLVRRRSNLGPRIAHQPVKHIDYRPENMLLAVGASTGGPAVIQRLLKELPADFPVPMVIAQHIAPGFLTGLRGWLSATTGYRVEIAAHHQRLEPGTAYLCPDGYQTGVSSAGRFVINDQSLINGVRPSVAHLFRTAAEAYGPRAVGVLLSGMGRDGARELKLIRDQGGITIVQDAQSSVVHGMPGEAIKLSAACHVVGSGELARLITRIVLGESRPVR
ncbi:MAG: chemotaxis protein CheB [Candidatus Melainabacteria bacterium]|nr:chemotaxis protein CheB [Candidatus Melainabacteria bacterium]